MADEDSQVHIKYNFTCPICKKFLKELLECESCHKLYCKNCAETRKKDNLDCVFCHKQLNLISNVGIQRLISNGDIKPKCPYCGKDFQNSEEYDNHQPICKAERYECKECFQEFKEKEDFWKHLIEKHKDALVREMEKIE